MMLKSERNFNRSCTAVAVRFMVTVSRTLHIPSGSNRRTVRDAGRMPANTPDKTASSDSRNNVAFRVDLRSEYRVCAWCSDHYRISPLSQAGKMVSRC